MNFLDPSDLPAERKITTSRVVPFSPAQVFQAFRDPTLLANWWGPDGFSNTFRKFDFRPGGDWLFDMHGPDGTDYPNESRFLELSEPTRIVFDHLGAPKFRTFLDFAPTRAGCQIDWCMAFEDEQTRAHVFSFAGGALEQNLNRWVAIMSEEFA